MRGLCVGGDMVILFFSDPAVFHSKIDYRILIFSKILSINNGAILSCVYAEGVNLIIFELSPDFSLKKLEKYKTGE